MASEPSKEYPADVVHGTFFEHDVPTKNMFVHFRTEPGGYARPLNVNRATKLMAEWDKQAVGVLLLSMRDDGRMAIIDGHHRVYAANMVGTDKLDALVYIDLSLEDEARLYRKFGDYLKQTALDRYHAGIAEKVPEYLAIARTLGKYSLHVPNAGGYAANAVVAVDALIRVAKTYGLFILDQVLNLLHTAWDGEHRAYRASSILGTAMFMARFQTNKRLNITLLARRMDNQGIAEIERKAASFKETNYASNPNAAWGQSLLFMHDKGLKAERQLGDWTRRHISETTRANLAQNLKDVNDSMTPEQRSARTRKAAASRTPEATAKKTEAAVKTRWGYSIRSVVCSHCHASTGKPCVTKNGNSIPQYHTVRRSDARTWANSKLKP